MERAKVFEKIIHAEDRRRNRELQATQDAARQKSAARPCTQRGKYGIIRDMKTRVSSALALTLAIAGGLAAPLRSDAANDTFLPATRHMPGISHFKSMAS